MTAIHTKIPLSDTVPRLRRKGFKDWFYLIFTSSHERAVIIR